MVVSYYNRSQYNQLKNGLAELFAQLLSSNNFLLRVHVLLARAQYIKNRPLYPTILGRILASDCVTYSLTVIYYGLGSYLYKCEYDDYSLFSPSG